MVSSLLQRGKPPGGPGTPQPVVTNRRSPAHSPVAGLGVLGHRTPQNSCWTSESSTVGGGPVGTQGCISGLSEATDARTVNQ